MQKRKGISLIVLVITIIVMIVLAGAIILSLNDSGIINKSNEAVKKTDEATVKELAQMAWAEAYASGVRKVEDEGTTKGFQTRVIEALKTNKVNTDDYGILVTTKGVEVARGWLQDGTRVLKGNKEIQVGTRYAYDEGTGDGIVDVDWAVLGAEDGELLIMSTTNILDNYQLGGNSSNVEEAKKDYIEGVAELHSLCSKYGNGFNSEGVKATKARSVTVEDINRVTGYVPNTDLYGKGEIYQYGNVVTYSWDGSNHYPLVNSVVQINQSALTGGHASGFYWYDEISKSFLFSALGNTAGQITATLDDGSTVVAKLKNTYYNYKGTNMEGMETTNISYRIIFGNISDSRYWLASSCIRTDYTYAFFGLRAVVNDEVKVYDLVDSRGYTSMVDVPGVRAVVSLP